MIDANVAAKWYVREPGSAQATAYLRQPVRRIAPTIIRLEVLGAITRTVRDSRANAEEAAAWCHMWQSHLKDRVIELMDVDDLMGDAIALSIGSKHPLYDCLYLVACKRMNATLVTFDEKLSKVANRIGITYELLLEPKLN